MNRHTRPGREEAPSPTPGTQRQNIRRTVRVILVILGLTIALLAFKYWVVSRYLLGH